MRSPMVDDSAVVSHLFQIAVHTAKLNNKMDTIRRSLESCVTRFGAKATEAWLMNTTDNQGKTSLEMYDELKSQKNRKSIARAQAKRNTRADPSSCALCLGIGSVKTGMIQGYSGPEEVWGSCPDCRG